MARSRSNSSKEQENGGKGPSRRDVVIWLVVLLVYAGLLCGIGYIAFWEQEFNKVDKTLAQYTDILEHARESSDGDDEQYELLVQDTMKASADSAGDLQELASQSFNIVLGALLAFLSASTTMVFQRLNEDDEEPPQ